MEDYRKEAGYIPAQLLPYLGQPNGKPVAPDAAFTAAYQLGQPGEAYVHLEPTMLLHFNPVDGAEVMMEIPDTGTLAGNTYQGILQTLRKLKVHSIYDGKFVEQLLSRQAEMEARHRRNSVDLARLFRHDAQPNPSRKAKRKRTPKAQAAETTR